MQRRYGTSEVCEFRFSQREVDELVTAEAKKRLRAERPLQFDTDNAALLKIGYDYVVRFVNYQVSGDPEAEACRFGPSEEIP